MTNPLLASIPILGGDCAAAHAGDRRTGPRTPDLFRAGAPARHGLAA